MELSRFKQQAAKAFTRLSLYKPLFGKSAGAPPTERAAEIEPKQQRLSKPLFPSHIVPSVNNAVRIQGGPPPLCLDQSEARKKTFFSS